VLLPKKWYVHWNYLGDNAPIVSSQDGNNGAHGQPELVYLSQFLQQHEGFEQEATHYVQKKEARKFHGEL
jgi:hypothetical protein